MLSDLRGGHNDFIDFLKGICILFIIVTHFSWDDATRLHLLFPFWIDMAVPVFMILSGYVMAYSYKRRGILSFEEAYSPKLLTRRLLRYIIPFAVAHVLLVNTQS